MRIRRATAQPCTGNLRGQSLTSRAASYEPGATNVESSIIVGPSRAPHSSCSRRRYAGGCSRASAASAAGALVVRGSCRTAGCSSSRLRSSNRPERCSLRAYAADSLTWPSHLQTVRECELLGQGL